MISQPISMRVLGLACRANTKGSSSSSSLSTKQITSPLRRNHQIMRPIFSHRCLSTCRKTPTAHSFLHQIRHSSSTATASSSPSMSNQPVQPLTWNRFLEIRKVRRQINVVTSLIGVGGALFASMYVVTTQEVDVLASMVGLDVLITMGIVVVATSAAGWLIGPVFGNLVFNMRYRALRGSILSKEKEFFQRIAKHRVDPTRSSYQNPVPDYYGEKIGSVRDYRRWLKDQRAFNLKRAG